MDLVDEVDRLTGIERYPESPAFGELVCEVIFLRGEPGGAKLSGVLSHGAEVRVTKRHKAGRRPYFYVEEAVPNDPELVQQGWVVGTFLERLGAEDAVRRGERETKRTRRGKR